jgi:hypothetical protein
MADEGVHSSSKVVRKESGRLTFLHDYLVNSFTLLADNS